MDHCGDTSPLALAIVGAVLASGYEEGNTTSGCNTLPPFDDPGRCKQIEQQLFENLRGGSGVFDRVIELGFDALRGDTARGCFVMLGVLAEGATVPVDMLFNLWGHVRDLMTFVGLK